MALQSRSTKRQTAHITSSALGLLFSFSVLMFVLTLSSGCNQVLGLDKTTELPLNGYACSCNCTSSNPTIQPITVTDSVCVPPSLNTLLGGIQPTQTDL